MERSSDNGEMAAESSNEVVALAAGTCGLDGGGLWGFRSTRGGEGKGLVYIVGWRPEMSQTRKTKRDKERQEGKRSPEREREI